MFNAVLQDDDSVLTELFAYLQQEGESNGETSALVNPLSPTGQGGPAGSYPATTPLELPRSSAPVRRDSKSRLLSVERSGSGGASKGKRQRDGDKVKELEALAAAKMEQFEALVRRNTELRYKSKILSEAVMLRDYTLNISRAAGQGLSRVPPPVPLPAGRLGEDASSSSAGAELSAARTVAQAVRAPGSMRLLLEPELQPPMDLESVRSTTSSQLAVRWKGFVSEASVLLLTLEEQPDEEAAAVHMRDLCAHVGCLFRTMSVLMPDVVLAVFQMHLESGSPAEPEPGLWPAVVRTLNLTDEQLRDLRAVYGLYDKMMQGVLAERRVLHAKLSSGIEEAQQQPPGTVVAQMRLPPEFEVMPALERNIRKESSAHLLLRSFVFGQKLSILQFCRAAVHAYPFFPNATGLVAAAAELVA